MARALRCLDGMEIDIDGDASITPQARTYAEYRLFAALAPLMDTARVTRASLVLRRARSRRRGERVACTVAVAAHEGRIARVHAEGGHPCEAIDRAVARARSTVSPSTRHFILKRPGEPDTPECPT